MNKKVLIISYSGDDYAIEQVAQSIEKHGGRAIVFYVDKYPEEHLLSVNYEDDRKEIWFDDGREMHDLCQLDGVWYRRLSQFGKGVAKNVDPEFAKAAWGECHVTFLGLMAGLSTDTFIMNPYQGVRHADAKEEQLRVAKSLGLKIPRTCITNNAAKAKEFVKSCKNGAISKMQSSFFHKDDDGNETVVFTNDVGEDDFERLDGIHFCPMKFQEKIAKKLELRITIVGDQCFTIAIDSQKNEHGKTDWRKLAHETARDWFPYELPQEIADKLVAYNKYFHLNYSAADILVTPDDEYIFLESNPAGEYLWADAQLDGAIVDHMGKILVGKATQLKHTPYDLLVENTLKK